MKRLGTISALALLATTGSAWAQSLQVVEVITSPQRTEFLRGQIDAFEAAHEGVTVELVSLPWGEAFEKFLTMVQAGETPDIVEMPERWLSLYANNDQLVDLSDYIGGWDEGDTLSDRTVEFANTVNDTPYMIPYGFYLRGLYWHKGLFAEAGIEEPPATLEEFAEVSARIAALGGGKSGYCLRGGPGGFGGVSYAMLSSNGKPFFNEDGTSTLNEPGAVAGLQMLVDMYQGGAVPRDSVNWGFNETVSGFYSGTCAMLDNDPDAMIGILEHMGADDFAVAPMPLGPDGTGFPSIGYVGWSMMADSANKDEAWALMAHLLANEQNVEWAKFVGVIPIHAGAENDPEFAVERYEGWFTELNDARWNPIPWPAHLEPFAYFFDVMSVQGTQEALLGQRSAQDVADEWAAYLTEAQQDWMAGQQ